jgi:hypothetical protein
MKNNVLVLFLIFFSSSCLLFASSPDEPRPTVSMPDANWNKSESETPPVSNPVVTIVEGISYSTTSEGILLIMPKASSNIKLFALTGDVVWQGNLVQGKFFIPMRPGVYFLRVNNKSYKIICR